MKLFRELEGDMKARTKSDYFYELNNTDKLNVISRIQRDLEKFKKALMTQKPGEKLTKQKTKEITKQMKEQNKNLMTEIKQNKVKKDEFTLEQKIKREEKAVKKYERKVLGGVYKKSTVYADDIDGVFGFETNKQNVSNISNIIYKMVSKDFTNMTSDKKFKCTLKSYVSIKTLMEKLGPAGMEEREFYFNSSPFDVVSINNIDDLVSNVFGQYENSLSQANNGSNWRFKKLIRFNVSSTVIKSALGKSYIELPKVIQNKKATINIKNNDDKCFDYALITSRIYKDHDKTDLRVVKKNLDKILIPDNIIYPITSNDIHLYEELNNIQINVFSLDGYTDDVEDVRTCINEEYKSNKHRKDVVNLLLIRENEKSHYVFITNLSRLFFSKALKVARYHCPHCIVKCYGSIDELNIHVDKCLNIDEVDRIKIDVLCECPEEGKNTLKFINNGRAFKHPFHVIADFESTLEKCNENFINEDDEDIKTHQTQKHIQNSFGIKYNCIHNEYSKPIKIFNSGDPEEVNKCFIETLEEYAINSYNLIQSNKDVKNIIYNNNEKVDHYKCKSCAECKKEFNMNDVKKVAHHDHITGRFISSLCSKCNIEFKYQKFIPVYLHNLKGYDSHLFVKSLHKYGQNISDITCIPNNEERYISFSKIIKVGEYYHFKNKKMEPILFEIRFLDTISFMTSSIES